MEFGIRIIDVLDIFIVAFLLFRMYKMVRHTAVMSVFLGIFVFVVVWFLVTFVFQMQLLGAIMDQVISVGMIAIIVIFKDEIRKQLFIIGSKNNLVMRILMRINAHKGSSTNEEMLQIVMACKSMAKQKTGALIVIKRGVSLAEIIKTGDEIDSKINSRLIENIFFKNSPLHDGAMIVVGDRIAAAGCILPVTHSFDVPKQLGLRHRAALGMSEESDAICVIVSEETGSISVAQNGAFRLDISPKDLEEILSNDSKL